MSDPFVSQIMTVAFSWAPRGWAICGGQQLLTQQNMALYALMGFQFGGDGKTNFNLPNCAGRTIIGLGTDQWGTTYGISTGETPPVSIGLSNLPIHSHKAAFTSSGPGEVTLTGKIDQPLSGALSGGLGARNIAGADITPNLDDVLGATTVQVYAPSGGTAVPLTTLDLAGTLTGTLDTAVAATVTVPPVAGTVSLQSAGVPGNVPLTAPYLVQTVIIALQGLFPQRP